MRPEEQMRPGPSYTVIPRTLIFLTSGTRVLLLRGAPDKPLWAGRYNGLGGHVEPGETPLRSAQRELAEEAGFNGVALMLRAIVHITLPQPPGVLLFVFVGEAPLAAPRPSAEGLPEWVEQATLAHLPLVPDLPVLLPRVLEPGALFFASYTFTEAGLHIDLELP